VELGQRNTDYVIVKSGLKAKEQLALMYPYPKTEEAKNEKEAAE
jgi:hypothetical protein